MMPSQYNIIIDMSFDSEDEMCDMEQKVYDACQSLFDNFENITIKISKDTTFEIDSYQKTTTEYSVKHVDGNNHNDNYDFDQFDF